MILTQADLTATIRPHKEKGEKIVLVTGFFDLLHAAHIDFLRAARASGDVLIVGVESDARARAKKGEGRPIFSQSDRAALLDELRSVDYVIALPDSFSDHDEREKFIKNIAPDILAVSASSPNLDAKRSTLAKFGIELRIVHPHVPGVSTSDIISKIRSSKS